MLLWGSLIKMARKRMSRASEKAMFAKKGVSRRDPSGVSAPFWVTTTDKFMSGWGRAEGKKNKLGFPCASYEEAEIVAENARNRSDQKNVNIRFSKPNFNQRGVLYQCKDKEEYPSWYQKGYFKPKSKEISPRAIRYVTADELNDIEMKVMDIPSITGIFLDGKEVYTDGRKYDKYSSITKTNMLFYRNGKFAGYTDNPNLKYGVED
jgi:hypothetical protein